MNQASPESGPTSSPDATVRTPDPSRGVAAAYGPRRVLIGRVRSKLFGAFRKFEAWTHAGKRLTADYIELYPPPTDAAELSDLAGRINWYYPQASRGRPLFMAVDGAASPDPASAWYMDPDLVADPGWTNTRPSGKRHLAIRKLTPRTAFLYLRHARNATLVDHSVGFGVEEGYFRLQRRFGLVSAPSPAVSLARLKEKQKGATTALVLATGPSASHLDPSTVTHDLRITCNSAVRDLALIRSLRPDVICFGDPVFHYGPSKYAAAFRTDLLRALDECDALLVTTQFYVEPLLAHIPEIADRVAVVPLLDSGNWRWPTEQHPDARVTSNVLTNLMLPVAFCLASNVDIAGCDGRNPAEAYFWKHNAATQYSDEMMRTAFEAHQAFFRDRDYSDYYDQHCSQLEALLTVAEASGKSAHGLTPSHIPALRKRGAADLAVVSDPTQ